MSGECVDPRCPGWVEFGIHAALPQGDQLRLEFAGEDDGLMPEIERHVEDVLGPVKDDIGNRIKDLGKHLERIDSRVSEYETAIDGYREQRLAVLSEKHSYEMALARLNREVDSVGR